MSRFSNSVFARRLRMCRNSATLHSMHGANTATGAVTSQRSNAERMITLPSGSREDTGGGSSIWRISVLWSGGGDGKMRGACFAGQICPRRFCPQRLHRFFEEAFGSTQRWIRCHLFLIMGTVLSSKWVDIYFHFGPHCLRSCMRIISSSGDQAFMCSCFPPGIPFCFKTSNLSTKCELTRFFGLAQIVMC